MDEKSKLIYMLLAIRETLSSRFNAPAELVASAETLLGQVSANIDPEMTVPNPTILLLVNDFKLSKHVADRL